MPGTSAARGPFPHVLPGTLGHITKAGGWVENPKSEIRNPKSEVVFDLFAADLFVDLEDLVAPELDRHGDVIVDRG